jgi:hypothetical protein
MPRSVYDKPRFRCCVKECVRTETMSCPTFSSISFNNSNSNFAAAKWLRGNGTFKIHPTAPREAAHLNFLWSSGRPIQPELVFLIQDVYDILGLHRFYETAVGNGIWKPRKSDRLFAFSKPLVTAFEVIAVDNGFEKPNKRSDFHY